MKSRLNRISKIKSIRAKGIAGSVLNLLFALAVMTVGLFSVELNRYLLARDQLKGDLEAAALCCQTTLTSTGTPATTSSQTAAQQAGLNIFQQNSILGESLSMANMVSLSPGQTSPQFDVQPGEAQICFMFLDPITRLPINNSSGAQNISLPTYPAGTLIQAVGAYSYRPFFGQFIGLGNASFTLQTSVNSGIPQLDLVFVYDVSGAENTQTPVTYLQRFWHNPYGIDYLIPSPLGTTPPGIMTGGPQWPFCTTNAPLEGPNPTTPQNLDNGLNCMQPLLKYSEKSGSATQLLTGAQANAAPPGNYPPPVYIWCLQGNYPTIGNIPYYMPCYPGPQAVLIPLANYYAVSTAAMPFYSPTNGFILGAPYCGPTNLTDYIVYVANGTGLPPTTPPGINQTMGFSTVSSTSNYQAHIKWQNGTTSTVTLGGGSSYGAISNAPPPTGPHPAVDPNTGGSTVASLLSGFSYSTYGTYFTHTVPNIDNNPTFNSFSVQYNGKTYKFPSLAALVEASLGNLESAATAQAAGLNLGAMGLSQSDLQSGYYAAYMQGALASIQPMNTVASATIAFMNQIATVSDAHFGCLTFNDYVGSNASSTAPPSNTPAPHNLASDYSDSSMNTNPDGTVGASITNTYLLPDILLDPNGNTTQSTITNVLPTIHTWGNCGVASALQAALFELNPQLSGNPSGNVARPSANKAIVLITTQAPNVGLNGDTGPSALSDALSMAKLAHKSGIPIYCVSIAQSQTDETSENAAYNDNNGGITAVAGCGGRYYHVNWSNPATTQTALTSAFANIARQLVCVVH